MSVPRRDSPRRCSGASSASRSRNATTDPLLECPMRSSDCLTGGPVLEVTTIGDQSAIEREAIAAKWSWHVDGAKRTWMVHVGTALHVVDAGAQAAPCDAAVAVRAALRERSATSSVRPPPRRRHQVVRELGPRHHGVATTRRPESIDVLPSGGGGAAFDPRSLAAAPTLSSIATRALRLINQVPARRGGATLSLSRGR